MNEEVFKSSLNSEDSYGTSSYDISKLFYVAFWGGIVSTIVLGTMNARWLRIDKKVINFLLALGALALIAKIVVYGSLMNWDVAMDSLREVGGKRELRWGFKAVSIGVFLIYYYAMKQKFQQHLVIEGEIKPLLKDAILWIILGGIIEAIFITGGVFVLGSLI